MAKIRILDPDASKYLGDPKKARHPRQFRSYDSESHPLLQAREYKRALNAAKLEKIFAKPFVAAMDDHGDTVMRVTRPHWNAQRLWSAGCDGDIRQWDLATREADLVIPRAHTSFITGLVGSHDDRFLFSTGGQQIHQWDLSREGDKLVNSFQSDQSSACVSVDHHWSDPLFAVCSTTVDVFTYDRSGPLHSFDCRQDSGRVSAVRFNPVETCLLAAAADEDHSIVLHDVRAGEQIHRITLKLKTNALCWNPRNCFTFVSANEDGRLYSFDMRYMDKPLTVHADHVMAVTDVDYSPCGSEFVSASWDKTIRLWKSQSSRSREVYHTKRMQRVLTAAYSSDGRFVISGSEDGNVRIWKSEASEKLGKLRYQDAEAKAYRNALKEHWGDLPEIATIRNHKHVPKWILNKRKELHISGQASMRKEEHVAQHSKGSGKRPTLKDKAVKSEEC